MKAEKDQNRRECTYAVAATKLNAKGLEFESCRERTEEREWYRLFSRLRKGTEISIKRH
jgi:hypothetical protein